MLLTALKQTIRADLDAGTERGRLIRSAGATAALKVGGILLAFGASLLYARALGPHGYGLYAYVAAWVAVLTVPAGMGLPQYLVREGVKHSQHLRALRRWADRRVVLSGAAAAVLMVCALFLPQAAGAQWLFVIAAPLPLLNSLGSVRRGLLHASGRVALSQWPLLILSPFTTLAALAILWAWRGTLYPIEVIAAMAGSGLLPLFINGFQLRHAAVKREGDTYTPTRLRAALPFMWLGGLYLINNRADLIMLGTLSGAHAAGVYAVSVRASELVAFFFVAANMAIAPRIAGFYQHNNQVLLQRLLTAATRRVLVLTVPVALLFILAGRPLLTYLYGASYAEGAVALQILAGAQLINVAAGPTGIVLNMTGHETLSALGVGLSAILNIALNATLIPFYGVEGAAVSTGVSLVFWNALLWFWTRKRLGLCPSALGI